MPRPSIKSPCVADRYADRTRERIAEFSDGEAGGLISVGRRDDGLHVSIYRAESVLVHVDPAILAPQSLRAAAKLYAERNPT